jgi:hypothetical protein
MVRPISSERFIAAPGQGHDGDQAGEVDGLAAGREPRCQDRPGDEGKECEDGDEIDHDGVSCLAGRSSIGPVLGHVASQPEPWSALQVKPGLDGPSPPGCKFCP